MTSLALLAHEGSRAWSAFNGLFCATVATVIPVLFLAIAVQNLLAGAVDAFARATKMAPLDENSSWREIGTGYGKLGIFARAILAARWHRPRRGRRRALTSRAATRSAWRKA